ARCVCAFGGSSRRIRRRKGIGGRGRGRGGGGPGLSRSHLLTVVDRLGVDVVRVPRLGGCVRGRPGVFVHDLVAHDLAVEDLVLTRHTRVRHFASSDSSSSTTSASTTSSSLAASLAVFGPAPSEDSPPGTSA